MQHQDHVKLIREGIDAPGGVWADLGSGSGAFTLALADLLGPGARIYSVDQDRRALRTQAASMRANFPEVAVEYREADFTRKLAFPLLDGVLMANSLHYVRHKGPVLELVRSYLRPTGRLLLVEYNTDRGNMWVPYPLAYPTWEALARQYGFACTRLLATVPSRFLREMYAAMSVLE
ncbi:MAG TPA: methyltransferase domain-containing protein [Ktedonobacteraceae bacterium]|jgi:SAM-dependent methyltransferase|nr:methyltransferase domain-containing protein [Ktedonobacteraceae bacterium]